MARKSGRLRRWAWTDCAASWLDAAVTAEIMISAPATASAAEVAQRTPLASAARRKLLPAACGKRMSHAVICAASASCSPAAIACPASPKPMKAILGLPFAMVSVIGIAHRVLWRGVLRAAYCGHLGLDDGSFAV